ncbi:Aspartic proteinase Asp1 [Acorus gramineus]|uniref:Aspartic proteinase Asp1 n=1 Tax=Acorus gramineus TaxID=55184 RepID=A0AAV9AWA2_ACOGR|nr:Aspartic proteinase Asp1 [Acorus gramineus]
MAKPLLRLILAVLFVVAQHLHRPSEALRDPEIIVRPSNAMVLQLVHTSANASMHQSHLDYRRHLQRVSSHTEIARMRLFDDLLTNGYYTTRLYIGTPPQEFALIVDSGSTVTYVPCSTCEQCGHHQDPRFQPDESSTYQPVKCNIDCTCDRDKEQCIYERQYAEMSSSSGVLGDDIVSFGNESVLKPQRAVFGCENTETGDLFSQHADGIMGLGRGQLSIMDQLVDKGVISDSFSLCYGGMDIGGGAMVLGGITPPADMVFSRSDPGRSPYYNIELKEIHVAGKPLQLNPRVFDGKHGTVLDSGTTYAYLPELAFVAFKEAIMEKLHSHKQIRGPDANYNDICFSGGGSDVSQISKTFPDVDMVFNNGQKLSLTPENYLFRHSKVQGAYCLGVFQNGKDPTTLLGGIIVRNTFVTYDRENQTIGFWKTNCSQLWERLHLPMVPSPAPSPSYDEIPSLGPAPAFPPSALQNSILPGEFRVGLITFDMFLSIKYPDLVPHVAELAKLIADELEISENQVHLMNFTREGNGSFVKWGIYPARSAGFISNTNASSIIFRLTEHRVRLPDNYGSYNLIEWKVEPAVKRAWLQQHIFAVVIGVVVTVFLCLLASVAIWHLWRQKQQILGTYRPVDAAVPEQELQLQPL